MLKDFVDDYYPDIKIISVNPVGLKGLFEDMYTKSKGYKDEKYKSSNTIKNKFRTSTK